MQRTVIIGVGALMLLAGGGAFSEANQEAMAESGAVRINEVLANPVGSDSGKEWVELANQSDQPVSVGGYKVVRASGVIVLVLETNQVIPAQGFIRFATRGSLLNSGDTLTLRSTSRDLDVITYDGAGPEGSSWSRLDGDAGWWSAIVTPEAPNATPASTSPAVPNATPTTPSSTTTPSITPVLASPVPPIPTASPTLSTTPTQTPQAGELQLNEFLPNPTGADVNREWLEIKNVSNRAATLENLKVLQTDGDVVATLPNQILQPGELYATLDLSGLLLNSGDSLQLRAGDTVIDSITYDEAAEGASWVRLQSNSGDWSSRTTRGAENQFVPIVVASPSPTATPTASLSPTPPATTPTASPSSSPEPSSPGARAAQAGELWLNELMPNPEGADTGQEWIELKNVTDETLDATGLTITQADGGLLATLETGTIAPGQLVTLTDLRTSLLNAGDTIHLRNGERILDAIAYDGEGTEGESWARQSVGGGGWTSHPTVGAENVFAAEVPAPATPASGAPVTASTAPKAPAKAATLKATATPKAAVKASTAKKPTATKASAKASNAKKLPATGMTYWPILATTALLTSYFVVRWKRSI